VDQGFHNWLLYSGQLHRIMKVQMYQQGEGPVNNLGSFYGAKKKIKLSLHEWGVAQGDPPHVRILNWNGDLSPAVHQLDRFS